MAKYTITFKMFKDARYDQYKGKHSQKVVPIVKDLLAAYQNLTSTNLSLLNPCPVILPVIPEPFTVVHASALHISNRLDDSILCPVALFLPPN